MAINTIVASNYSTPQAKLYFRLINNHKCNFNVSIAIFQAVKNRILISENVPDQFINQVKYNMHSEIK